MKAAFTSKGGKPDGEELMAAKRPEKFSGFCREVEAVRGDRGADTCERRSAAGARVLRGGSFNNNDRDNLLSSNRNNNTPGNRNRNNNNGGEYHGTAQEIRPMPTAP